MRRRPEYVTMSSKGQIVVPVALRRSLRLRAGQRLRVEAGTKGEVVFSPEETAELVLDDARTRFAAWTRSTGRNLVAELHDRRQAEREREQVRRERGRH